MLIIYLFTYINLIIQLSHIQGHKIRIVLYAYLNSDLLFLLI
jgi:hypothetical protein